MTEASMSNNRDSSKIVFLLAISTSALIAGGCAGPKVYRNRVVTGQTDPAFRDVRRLVKEACFAHSWPGANVGLVLPGGEQVAIAEGIACRGDNRRLLPSDRMFSGSIGKTYVVAVLLQLVEEGSVNLDENAASWFAGDEWFSHMPNSKTITLRMLLNHTTGIPRHIMQPAWQATVKAEPEKIWKPEELLAYVFDMEPLFAAGTSWSYADTNYIVAGMIIERATGQTYYDELRRRILIPFDLHDTIPADKPTIERLVCGYTGENNIVGIPREVATNNQYKINPQVEWTGGGLASTALDLACWASQLYGGRVLDVVGQNTMMDCVAIPDRPGRAYGLGVMIRPSRLGTVIGHGGWVPGYVSTIAYYPALGLALAIQINTDQDAKSQDIEDLLDNIAETIKEHSNSGHYSVTNPNVASSAENLLKETRHQTLHLDRARSSQIEENKKAAYQVPPGIPPMKARCLHDPLADYCLPLALSKSTLFLGFKRRNECPPTCR